jgi:hypothetical protein
MGRTQDVGGRQAQAGARAKPPVKRGNRDDAGGHAILHFLSVSVPTALLDALAVPRSLS